MPGLIFELVRDARGSVVHVRHGQSGECIGCIEAGLFEIVRALVLDEEAATASGVCGGRRTSGSRTRAGRKR